jgi:branched-chain amino acid transport system permease protein
MEPFDSRRDRIGVVAFQFLEERIWSSFLEIHSGVLGLVIVLLVFCLPGGWCGFASRRS